MFKYTFISINFGITWDLYKSVRSPFDSNNTRHELIMLAAPTMFVAFWFYWLFHELFNIKTENEDPVCGDLRFDLMLAPGETVIQLLYAIYTLYVLFIVIKGLCKKGLNKEIKKTFMRRQFMYIVIIIGTQIQMTVWNIYIYFKRYDSKMYFKDK